MTQNIRPPALAGSWYPADAATLRASVAGFLDLAAHPAAAEGRPAVAVVPHAGHAWSGEVAGGVLGLLSDLSYDRVILMAPNHRLHLTAPSCPAESAYATPLGIVPIDEAARAVLIDAGAAVSVPEAHAREHAEEIQLPFLQRLWDDVPPVLPLLVPHLDDDARHRLARTLGRWCGGRTLFLVSTDFTHYGADFGYLPFAHDVPRRLEQLDMGAVDCILRWDAAALLRYGRDTGITMCGLEAMAAVMTMPWPAAPRMALTGYQRSGDRDGDHSLSVSYVGMIGTLADRETP